MPLQQIINGVTIGAVYTLLALSYALIMGILGVLNLSIAEVFMVGGYFGFTALISGHSILVAGFVAMIGAAVLALLVERFAYRPLRDAPIIMPMLSTLGISIVLQNIAVNVWGSDPLQLSTNKFSDHRLEIAGLGAAIDGTPIVILLVTLVLVLVLAVTVQSTWLGRALRSAAENRDVARLLGVSATYVTIWAFSLSGILAGSAGVLIELHYGALTPYVGVDVGLKAMAVMVVVGTSRIWGVLVAGPLLGTAEVLTIAYGGSSYRDIVIYGLMIVILLVRPEAILGKPRPMARQRI